MLLPQQRTIKHIQINKTNYVINYESKKLEYKLLFRKLNRTGKSQELENFVEQKSTDLEKQRTLNLYGKPLNLQFEINLKPRTN